MTNTIFKASFVAIAYLVLGKFVVAVFVMLPTLLTDFSKIALASDHVRPSRKPETWKIGGFIAVSVVLGLAMLGESLLLLSLAWTRLRRDRRWLGSCFEESEKGGHHAS